MKAAAVRYIVTRPLHGCAQARTGSWCFSPRAMSPDCGCGSLPGVGGPRKPACISDGAIKGNGKRPVLAPVYGWFTEGFDTLSLKQAKALLDELHA